MLVDNKVPRYFLYGVVIFKSISIYGKMKALVAVNQASISIIAAKHHEMSQNFDSEEELADLMTKRMIE